MKPILNQAEKAFLRASRQGERVTLGIWCAMAGILLILTVTSIVLWLNAKEQTRIAEKARNTAEGEAMRAKQSTKVAEKATKSAQSALTTSFFRTIGRKETLDPLELEALWELAALSPENEAIRGKLLEDWLDPAGDPLPAFRNDACGLASAVGMNFKRMDLFKVTAIAAHELSVGKKSKDDEKALKTAFGWLSALRKPKEIQTEVDELVGALISPASESLRFTLAQTLCSLAEQVPGSIRREQYRRISDALINGDETNPYLLSRLGVVLGTWKKDSDSPGIPFDAGSAAVKLIEAMKWELDSSPDFKPSKMYNLAEAVAAMSSLFENHQKHYLSDCFIFLVKCAYKKGEALDHEDREMIRTYLEALVTEPSEEWCRNTLKATIEIVEANDAMQNLFGDVISKPLEKVLAPLADKAPLAIGSIDFLSIFNRVGYSSSPFVKNSDVFLSYLARGMREEDRVTALKDILLSLEKLSKRKIPWISDYQFPDPPPFLYESIAFDKQAPLAFSLYGQIVEIMSSKGSSDGHGDLLPLGKVLYDFVPHEKTAEKFAGYLKINYTDEILQMLLLTIEKDDQAIWLPAVNDLVSAFLADVKKADFIVTIPPSFRGLKKLSYALKKKGVLDKEVKISVPLYAILLAKIKVAGPDAGDIYSIASELIDLNDDSQEPDLTPTNEALLELLESRFEESSPKVAEFTSQYVSGASEDRFELLLNLAWEISENRLRDEGEKVLISGKLKGNDRLFGIAAYQNFMNEKKLGVNVGFIAKILELDEVSLLDTATLMQILIPSSDGEDWYKGLNLDIRKVIAKRIEQDLERFRDPAWLNSFHDTQGCMFSLLLMWLDQAPLPAGKEIVLRAYLQWFDKMSQNPPKEGFSHSFGNDVINLVPLELKETRRFMICNDLSQNGEMSEFERISSQDGDDIAHHYRKIQSDELLDILKWPVCRGATRSGIVNCLEKRFEPQLHGRKFDGNYWKFLQATSTLGMKEFDTPARRPLYSEAIAELDKRIQKEIPAEH